MEVNLIYGNFKVPQGDGFAMFNAVIILDNGGCRKLF